MVATANARGATPPRINFEIFDAQCAARDATDETARGKLVGVDRGTIWRWRTGRQVPSLETIQQIAEQFGIPMDQLLEKRAA